MNQFLFLLLKGLPNYPKSMSLSLGYTDFLEIWLKLLRLLMLLTFPMFPNKEAPLTAGDTADNFCFLFSDSLG